jgi:type I restriction enzyme, S subunit
VTWTLTRLGDVLQLERIPVDVDPEAEYTQIGIRSFGRGIFHRDRVPGDQLSKLRYFEVHPDRLVVSNIMAWEGAIGISTISEAHCVGSARFLSYRATGSVDLNYLNYFFQSAAGISRIAQASTGTVLRNQTLSPKNFEALEIVLPDLEEQRRVAAKLSQAFAGLGEVAGHREHVKSLRSEFLHSSLHDLPGRPLADFLTTTTDTTVVTPEGSYQTAGIYSYGRGLFARPVIYGTETSYKQYNRLRAGQFVYSKLFGWEGALAVVPEEFDGFLVSHEFPTFTIDRAKADVRYVAHLARWPELHSRLRGKTTGVGSRRQRVNVAQLLAAMAPLPDLDKQRRIAGILDRAQEAGRLAEHQESLAGALRQSLLNTAFSGGL